MLCADRPELGKLSHQDIGQMDLYVRWFEEHMKTALRQPDHRHDPVCSEKNETIVKVLGAEGKQATLCLQIQAVPAYHARTDKRSEQELCIQN
jgi:hypothetical protein